MDFFEAKGVDAVYLPFHKANQFLGMSPLPTFLCVDVMKRPAIEADVARYQQHLAQVLALAALSAEDIRRQAAVFAEPAAGPFSYR